MSTMWILAILWATIQLRPLLYLRYWMCGEGCIQKTLDKELTNFLMEVLKKNEKGNCLLWHSKMLCAHQIHFVFYLRNISQTSYNSIPTVGFTWLIKYGWKWWVPLPSMANTRLLHMDLHSPLQWPWRPHIRIIVSKDGRRLGFRMTVWSSLDSPHHPSCQLPWTLIWGVVCYSS